MYVFKNVKNTKNVRKNAMTIYEHVHFFWYIWRFWTRSVFQSNLDLLVERKMIIDFEH